MKHLKLSDEILLQVEKPARYIGNELNSIEKNMNDIDVRFVMCFPDIYEIGMSHLGLQIIYDYLNRRDDVWCERLFSPASDLETILREKNIPLFSLESQQDVKSADFLGFTLQYEMSYTNILNVLELSDIPLLTKDRREEDPIVVAGGPCSYNPEPLADFIDFFYIGEGETKYYEIMDVYKEGKEKGLTRVELLELIAEVDGMYVPSFYDVTYKEDGTIESFTKNNSHAADRIKKQVVVNMTDVAYPEAPIVPFIQTVHDRAVLELFRGCIRGCRFCQAGMIYRPVREKNVEHLKELALKLIKNTGHEEISLISLSSSDYEDLGELANYLIETVGKEKHVNLSLPSLRIDEFSLDLMQKVQDVRKSSLTFAPEAGSQRMRDVINKGLTEDDILNGAKDAFVGGWNRVKLYFMLGLPTETEEDILAIANLGQAIVEKYYEIPKEERTRPPQIVLSTSFFVPKAFTPFQWMAQDNEEQFLSKQQLLNENVNKKRIRYNSHDAATSVLEGVFARGDRRAGQVILKAFENGARFDAWSEHFKSKIWDEAFEALNMTPAFYAQRVRDFDEILPWDFIDIGVTKKFLMREYERAVAEQVTPNCKEKCEHCGATVFKGGICFEDKN